MASVMGTINVRLDPELWPADRIIRYRNGESVGFDSLEQAFAELTSYRDVLVVPPGKYQCTERVRVPPVAAVRVVFQPGSIVYGPGITWGSPHSVLAGLRLVVNPPTSPGSTEESSGLVIDSSHCRIEDCVVSRAYTNNFYVRRGSQHVWVLRCSSHDPGYSSFRNDGNCSVFRDCYSTASGTSHSDFTHNGPADELTIDGFVVHSTKGFQVDPGKNTTGIKRVWINRLHVVSSPPATGNVMKIEDVKGTVTITNSSLRHSTIANAHVLRISGEVDAVDFCDCLFSSWINCNGLTRPIRRLSFDRCEMTMPHRDLVWAVNTRRLFVDRCRLRTTRSVVFVEPEMPNRSDDLYVFRDNDLDDLKLIDGGGYVSMPGTIDTGNRLVTST